MATPFSGVPCVMAARVRPSPVPTSSAGRASRGCSPVEQLVVEAVVVAAQLGVDHRLTASALLRRRQAAMM